MDRRAWRAVVHGVTKELNRTERLTLSAFGFLHGPPPLSRRCGFHFLSSIESLSPLSALPLVGRSRFSSPEFRLYLQHLEPSMAWREELSKKLTDKPFDFSGPLFRELRGCFSSCICKNNRT